MRVKDAFTMIEIIVVLIIIGILAAMALPNFTSSLRSAHARDAINNLLAIHLAQQTFKENDSNHGYYEGSTTATLNTGLDLNITPSKSDDVYSCLGNRCAVVTDSFTMMLDMSIPISITDPQYCVLALPTVPTAAYNPCCGNPGGGIAAGAACPQ